MPGPPGGRRPIDEATNPQGRGEWFWFSDLGLSAPLHGGAAFPVLAANLFGDGFRGNQDDVWAGWLAGIPSSLAA